MMSGTMPKEKQGGRYCTCTVQQDDPRGRHITLRFTPREPRKPPESSTQ